MRHNQPRKPWYAHVTVATVIEKDNHYLLVEERKSKDIASQQLAPFDTVFNQPAGHLEPDESLVQAAVRETLEETAWHVKITGILGFSQFKAANKVTYLRSTFIAEALEYADDRSLDRDIIAAHWFSYEEIVAHQNKLRSPMVLADIERHRAGISYPLDLYRDFI